MSYKTEFPSFNGEFPVIDGFKDSSWHNDMCPSLEFMLNSKEGARVWIDFENPEDREDPGSLRYAFSLIFEGSYYPIFSTDNFNHIKDAAQCVKARLLAGKSIPEIINLMEEQS